MLKLAVKLVSIPASNAHLVRQGEFSKELNVSATKTSASNVYWGFPILISRENQEEFLEHFLLVFTEKVVKNHSTYSLLEE